MRQISWLFLILGNLVFNHGFANDIEIIRSKEKFKISSPSKAIHYQELSIKVNNKEGLKKLKLFWLYTSFIQITEFKATVMYAGVIKSYQLKDLVDQSLAGHNYQLFSDLRVKYLPIENQLNFPAIIHYTVGSRYKGFNRIPSFMPADNYDVTVKEASYELEYPTTYLFHRNYYGFTGTIDSNITERTKTLKFTLTNLAGIRKECHQLPLEMISPNIQFIPSQIYFDKVSFDCRNWDDIAQWSQTLLNESNGELGSQTKTQIDILKVQFSGKALAEKIYEWMQSRVRYVGIQLGIGGFKPIGVTNTDKYSYGDCKALSLYYVKLLQHAGIKGYYTLIQTRGEKPSGIPDFNGLGSFNHATVCIPLEGDTFIAECTSQTAKFNENNHFTGGQYGLMIIDGKGIWYKFPEPSTEIKGNSFHLKLIQGGKIEINSKPISEFGKWSNQIFYFDNKLLVSGFGIHSLSVCQTENRTSMVYFKDTLIWSDTLRIEDNKMQKKVLPPIRLFENRMGKYTSIVIDSNNTVLWVIKLQLNAGLYPIKDYELLLRLMEELRTGKKDELEIKFIN
jgi:hypothetical protein